MIRNTDTSKRWPTNLRGLSLTGQQGLLRSNDLEIGRHTTLIPDIGQFEHLLSADNRLLRLSQCTVQRGAAQNAVLDLLHRSQHNPPVVCDSRLIAGLGEIDVRADPATIEEGLCQRHAKRPQKARCIEQ